MHALTHSIKIDCFVLTRSYSTLYPRVLHPLYGQHTNISHVWEDFARYQAATSCASNLRPLHTYRQKICLYLPEEPYSSKHTQPLTIFYKAPLTRFKTADRWMSFDESLLSGYQLKINRFEKRVGVIKNKHIAYEFTRLFHRLGLYTTLTIDERPVSNSKKSPVSSELPNLRQRIVFHAQGLLRGLPQQEHLFSKENDQLCLFMRRTNLYNPLGQLISQKTQYAPNIITYLSWVYDEENRPIQLKTPNGTFQFVHDNTGCVKKKFIDTGLRCSLVYENFKITKIKEAACNQKQKIWHYIHDPKSSWVKEVDPCNQVILHRFNKWGEELQTAPPSRLLQTQSSPSLLNTKYVTDRLERPILKTENQIDGGQSTIQYTYDGALLVSETHETGRKWLYRYDHHGNLTEQHRHDQMEQNSSPELEIQYFYDSLNRMTAKIDYQDAKSVYYTEFSYDRSRAPTLKASSQTITLKPGQKLKHKKIHYNAWGEVQNIKAHES